MKENVLKKFIGLFTLLVTIMLPNLVSAETSLYLECGTMDSEGIRNCTVTYNIVDETESNLTVILTEQGDAKIISISEADDSNWVIGSQESSDVWTVSLGSSGVIGEGNLFNFSYQVEGIEEDNDEILVSLLNSETIYLDSVSTTGQTVTVGEVDMPVYSVDITWGDLTYNYKYNDITKEYYWREQTECKKLETVDFESYAYNRQMISIYSDDSCEKELSYDKYNFEEALSNNVYYIDDAYYTEYDGGTIEIVDNSLYAQVTPKITWESEDKYSFVNGKFQYADTIPASCEIITEEEYNYDYGDNWKPELYLDSKCLTLITDENLSFSDNTYYWAPTGALGWVDFVNNNSLEEASLYNEIDNTNTYILKLKLENDSTKEATMPVTGDTIGTVTITLTAN